MTEPLNRSAVDRRNAPRAPFHGRVTIEFEVGALDGVGQDLNPDGVLFVADGAPRVKVRVEGREQPVDGELVRVQALGAARFGIAVRFTS